MKVLITGADGFVGGALASELSLKYGCDVVALGRRTPTDHQRAGIRRVSHDLTKPLGLNETVDYIIHSAACQNFRQMPLRDFLAENLEMARNVAEYGVKTGARGVIFTSSINLHGEIRSRVVDENSDRINPSLYGISKFLCEELLREYTSSLPGISLRLCGVVGRGPASCWLAGILVKALRGERIDITNGQRKFNNIVHTDDLAKFIHTLMVRGVSGFSAFPLASRQPMSIRDVVAEIVSISGSQSVIYDRGITHDPFIVSNSCAISRFGYAPESVSMNLRKFVSENVSAAA